MKLVFAGSKTQYETYIDAHKETGTMYVSKYTDLLENEFAASELVVCGTYWLRPDYDVSVRWANRRNIKVSHKLLVPW